MRLPSALIPLRHPAFRMLWIANIAANTGMWLQNTGAGWLMTSLAPDPLVVSLVQASSMLPVFLLALPSGALADILDRRLTLIGAYVWVAAVSVLLALLTFGGGIGPWGLLLLTFLIGAGGAMSFPAWAATTPELVPREDLVQAITLNGIGFNLTRAVGPAIGGFVIAAAGAGTAFALNALSCLVMLWALVAWRRPAERSTLPKEHFVGAMRAGLRFVAASPALRAAIIRAVTFFFAASTVWALLPLFVRHQLGLGPEAFGVMLGAMGAGAVASGFAMPALARRWDRGTTVLGASLLGAAAMALLGVSHHWLPAVVAMLLYGVSWLVAASALQAAAQLAAPSWVRARAIAIYQLSFFGSMTLGSVLWGWAGSAIGLTEAFLATAVLGAAAAFGVARWRLEPAPVTEVPKVILPRPLAPADALKGALHDRSGRVIEVVRYHIPQADRARFLAAMAEVRGVRLRSGAEFWVLYEDIALPERWIELWAMESWTEHLREADRLQDADRATLARAAALHRGDAPPEAARYLSVDPGGG